MLKMLPIRIYNDVTISGDTTTNLRVFLSCFKKVVVWAHVGGVTGAPDSFTFNVKLQNAFPQEIANYLDAAGGGITEITAAAGDPKTVLYDDDDLISQEQRLVIATDFTGGTTPTLTGVDLSIEAWVEV